MAAPAGGQAPPLSEGAAPDIIEALEAQPESFSYFQALRLLGLKERARFPSLSAMVRRGLSIRASIDLGFPASDLAEVRRLGPGSAKEGWLGAPGPAGHGREEGGPDALYGLTVTFMGLCGSASPLPPFYAQDVAADFLNDDMASRGLFDLVSQPSYRNHAEAYFRSQLPFRLLEDEDRSSLEILFCLMGLGHPSLQRKAGRPRADLAYLSLLSSQARHGLGLLAYLSGRLGLGGLSLEECVLRRVPIPPGQRCRLGQSPGGEAEEHGGRRLGLSSTLGRESRDMAGKFRLVIPAGSQELFLDLMPGGALRAELEGAVGRYLTSPLVYDILLVLAPGQARGIRLGAPGSGLGLTAFLSPRPERETRVVSQAAS